jgi:phosphoribosylcarboxyaminoimidazole (NCAIR) mutase
MREYIVYRHGFDDETQCACQGLPEKMPVARIEAENADEACNMAAHLIALSANQYLTAEPAESVDAEEENINRRVEAL